MSAAAADARAGELARLVGAGALDRAPAGPGRIEHWRVAPADEEQAAEVLRWAAHARVPVVACGNGSKLGWVAAPPAQALLVSTRRMRGIVRHEPGDGTLSARAGTPMADLRAAARTGGHFLTPDVPAPARATLGGVVAAGQSGWDRLRFGPVRHHVLGVRVLMADGTVARSGGQLVKNVTGFDLQRLHTGAHGTLGLLLEVALRLFAEPEHEALAIAGAADGAAALALAQRVRLSRVRPLSLFAARVERTPSTPRAPAWVVHARLAGRRAAVRDELEHLRDWTRWAVLEGEEARGEAEELRDRGFEAAATPWMRGLIPAAQAASALEGLERELERADLAGRIWVQPAGAVLDVQFPGLSEEPPDADRLARFADAWTAHLARHGGRADLRDAPPVLERRVRPAPGEPVGLAWMRRLKDALDPEHLFATGRLRGGL